MMAKIIAHQKLPVKHYEREILREKGQFWTPDWVAGAMMAYVSGDTDLVFDPATGRGAFYEALLKINKNNILFYGTDIDPEVLSDPIFNNNRCLIEVRDFIKNPPPRKFMSIIANPPYIRHHRIDENTKIFLKCLSARITGCAIDGRAGYHIYFLIQALNLLEPAGKLAFIMPADTCEGKFSKNLWQWISEKFCIECAVTFDQNATPFPGVDTNAVVFMIKNTKPADTLFWVRANKAYSTDLLNYISSGFKNQDFNSLQIVNRSLDEAIATGLSRPAQTSNSFKFHLHDFAHIMRGIATGSNEFFFLTGDQVKDLKIPHEFLKRAIGRTRDITSDIITPEDIEKLENDYRPTYLLSINGSQDLPTTIKKYLQLGEESGLPERSLIKQRSPWYKMETRKVPPLLFAYLGRRNTRFIRNVAGVLPLTGFLCVYPIYDDPFFTDRLWKALNHPDTLENLKLVGKSYGSGAIKVEPRNLGRLPVPEHVVNMYSLKKPYQLPSRQLELFREPKPEFNLTQEAKTTL